MNISKFTQGSQGAIAVAKKLASQNGSQQIDERHLPSTLLTVSGSLIASLVAKMGIQEETFLDESEALIQKLPKVSGGDQEYVSAGLDRILDDAEDETKAMGDDYVSIEHLLLDFLKNPNRALKELLRTCGIICEKLLQALSTVRGNRCVILDNPEATYDTLNKYGYDLVECARDQELDPVAGRDKEIRNTIRILSRKTKDNPALTSGPGVGRTVVVEGLAQHIIRSDMSEGLEDKRLFAFDMDALAVGAKYHDKFRKRLKVVPGKVKKGEGEVILFIDELHTIVGTDASKSSMDAGSMLKPMLVRGELHCIGATTFDEYRKYIEEDPAFGRRFQPILVDQLTVEDMISILRGSKECYKDYHHAKVQDGVLVSAAMLSDRYITDCFLPDKAINLVDEACVMIKTEFGSLPVELDEMDHRRIQLGIEAVTLRRETGNLSKEKLEAIEKRLTEKKTAFAKAKTKWKSEKANVSEFAETRRRIEDTNHEIRAAQQAYDLNRAVGLQYGKFPGLQKQLAVEEAKVQGQDFPLVYEVATENEIVKIISRRTNTPIVRLTESEKDKTLHPDDTLHRHVISQNEAVEKVAEAIQRSEAGIKDPPEPIDSFLFLGPTDVGKIELVKNLTVALFDDESAMVRPDMPGCMEKFSVSRLIRAPPDYVSCDEGGQLTETVGRKPYPVVLFDEVEKTHPDVLNILLQVLDDGHTTGSLGRTVDFRDTIIIMTSNLGSQYLLDGIDEQGNIKPEAAAAVNADVKAHFRPEFLNRLDETITFKSLTEQNIGGIVGLLLRKANRRLADREIPIGLTPAAEQYAADEGYDPAFGARSLKHFLQKHVKTLVAKLALSSGSGLHKGAVIRMDVDEKKGDLRAEVVT